MEVDLIDILEQIKNTCSTSLPKDVGIDNKYEMALYSIYHTANRALEDVKRNEQANILNNKYKKLWKP